MKSFARLYMWIVIAIIMQVFVLAYFNYIYLPKRSTVKATLYEQDDKKIRDKSIKIPVNAEGIKASFDASYVCYISEGEMKIVDINSKRNIKSINTEGNLLPYYRWLPDRNMLIFSVKSPQHDSDYVQISTYDADTGVERSYPKISGLSKDSRVMDIELSPLTNIVYVKVQVSESRASIYKYNIMDNLKYIMNTGLDIVIKETLYEDKLVYQRSDKRIFIKDGTTNTTREIRLENEAVLMDIDVEDRIYIGEFDKNKKVNKVFYGTADDYTSKSMQHILLPQPVDADNIVISGHGMIYVLDNHEQTIYNINSKEKIHFTGRVVQILDDYVVSTDGSKLKFAAIKNN